MSGGFFDYQDFRIGDIETQIEELVRSNNDTTLNEWGECKGRHFSEATIEEFNKAVYYLRMARTYAHRVDWLVSGDDGEEAFHKRLKEDLNE